MKRAKPYVVVAELPACSAVLHVNGKDVTIHLEDTAEACKWYAIGLCTGSRARIQYGGRITLPAGNPAISYKKQFMS